MILILGSGLIGLNLARDLVDKGENVLMVSWFHERHKTEVPSFLFPFWGKQVKEVEGDVLDWSSMVSLVANYPIESIVHAAGIWPDRPGSTSLCHVVSVDVIGTLNILEIAHIFGLRRVTYISSINAYFGLNNGIEAREDMDLPAVYPDTVGATKKASEQICSLYESTYGMSVPIIRPARVYGPTAHWRRNPMERMVVGAIEGRLADCLDTDEGSYLSSIHAKDCARGISLIHLAKELKYNIYNLADGNYITYGELANTVRDLLPNADISLAKDKKLDTLSWSYNPINTERIRSEGWTPEYGDLRKGIQAYVDYLRHEKY